MTTTLLFADGVWGSNPHPRAVTPTFTGGADVDVLTSADAAASTMDFGRIGDGGVGVVVVSFPNVGPLVINIDTVTQITASFNYRYDDAGQNLFCYFMDLRTYEGAEDPEADAGFLQATRADTFVPFALTDGNAGNGSAAMQDAYDNAALGALLVFPAPVDVTPGLLSYFVVNMTPGDVSALAPPLRVYPRDDALTGGAGRTYPPSKTQQRGIRRGAGSYL